MLIRTAISALSPAGQNGKLSILIFHRVLPLPDPLLPDEPDVARYDQIMLWIRNWFNVLPLDEAVTRLKSGTLPARAAAITFDDGYADNLLHAAPILKKHELPATFFIATGFLDGGIMWNDRVIEAVRNANCTSISAKPLGLDTLAISTSAEKLAALNCLLPAIKHLPPEKRHDMVDLVVDACGADLPSDLMLTKDQLVELRDIGMGIGAHTVSHPILTRLKSDAAQSEIGDSRDYLKSILRQHIPLFAYPNGKFSADYGVEHTRIARSLGFSAALTTTPGVSRSGTDPFQLPRFTPWDRSRLKFGCRLLDNFRRRELTFVDPSHASLAP